jgi:hypothetical protein
MWQLHMTLHSRPFDSDSEALTKMWVLGDGNDGFLDLADIRFDFKRITVAELARVNEGVVAFTTPLPTVEMVRSVLATSRVPLVKIGVWESSDVYDAEWSSLPSKEKIDALIFDIETVAEAAVVTAAALPTSASKRVKTRGSDYIDVQRFLPYATISFFGLAVVAVWYAVYLSNQQEQMASKVVIADPLPIIEQLPLLPQTERAVAGKQVSPELLVSAKWVIPQLQQTSDYNGKLHWLIADNSAVLEGSRIATIDLDADLMMLSNALSFKAQVLADSSRRQSEFDASYQVQLRDLNIAIRQGKSVITQLERDLDEQARNLQMMKLEAAQSVRSFSELKPFENDLHLGQLQREKLVDALSLLKSQKTSVESVEVNFDSDAMYLSLLANADDFIELATQSLAVVDVYAQQDGVVKQYARSGEQVSKGGRLCEIDNVDFSYFICTIKESDHHSSYRQGHFFLRLDDDSEYFLDIHSETWNHGVFSYKLKMDVIRHNEVFEDLDSNLNYDIIFRAR